MNCDEPAIRNIVAVRDSAIAAGDVDTVPSLMADDVVFPVAGHPLCKDIAALIYTTLSAKETRDRVFASILIVYFTLHIAELQTAFDTSISYPLLAFMFVSAAVLYWDQEDHSQTVLTLFFSSLAKLLICQLHF